MAVLDVDHFKRINDTYGHPAGDSVLRKLGFLLKTNVRKGTVVARWGGEEFLVVFPNMELSIATLIMDRFREKVANTIRVEERIVTISAGLAQVCWDNRSSLEDVQARLIEEADQNLYTAKRDGRNRVHWQPVTSVSLNVPPVAVAKPSPALSLPF